MSQVETTSLPNVSKNNTLISIGCSFKFLVDVEELIVNVPLVSQHSKNTNNEKSEDLNS
jgi:hypothetical protein